MSVAETMWRVYLSGEIHTEWRKEIEVKIKELGLPCIISGPICVHEDSDDCGALIMGDEEQRFWYDRKGASLNSIRTRKLIDDCDIMVVRFSPVGDKGEKYKQWNAAFDAGYAAAKGKSLITLHDIAHQHPLKEINAAAKASCRTKEEVVQALTYIMTGKLPQPPEGFVPMQTRINNQKAKV